MTAIVHTYHAGVQLGDALGEILYGKVNPSGRLPHTLPNTNNDTNMPAAAFPGWDYKRVPRIGLTPTQVNYTEKLNVGYRWYHTHNVKPAFPFGHGLSYSTFEYSNFAVTNKGGKVQATVTIKNSVRWQAKRSRRCT